MGFTIMALRFVARCDGLATATLLKQSSSIAGSGASGWPLRVQNRSFDDLRPMSGFLDAPPILSNSACTAAMNDVYAQHFPALAATTLGALFGGFSSENASYPD